MSNYFSPHILSSVNIDERPTMGVSMEAKTSKTNIYQKMLKVMKAVSYIQKTGSVDTEDQQYKFVKHDAVVASLRPEFVKQGIVVLTRVTKHTQDGNRTEIDVEVDFINADNPDEKITIPSFGYGIDNQDKGPGKAISYAVKYAFLKSLCLETGDDPENESIDHKPKKQNQAEIIVNSFITAMEHAETLEDLVNTFNTAQKEIRKFKNQPMLNRIIQAKERRKAQLLDMKEAA